MRQAFLQKAPKIERIIMVFSKQSPLFDSAQALLEITKHLDSPPAHKILRPISTHKFAAPDELDRVRNAWREYQSTRRRDAIYDYLSEVFTTVRRWKEQDRTDTKVDQALKATGYTIRIRNSEPFGMVLFCTSDADTKTRSKWSRALRFAERSMTDTKNLARFMQRVGGINACADRFPQPGKIKR
jgi:hypothetical protein